MMLIYWLFYWYWCIKLGKSVFIVMNSLWRLCSFSLYTVNLFQIFHWMLGITKFGQAGGKRKKKIFFFFKRGQKCTLILFKLVLCWDTFSDHLNFYFSLHFMLVLSLEFSQRWKLRVFSDLFRVCIWMFWIHNSPEKVVFRLSLPAFGSLCHILTVSFSPCSYSLFICLKTVVRNIHFAALNVLNQI